ncbi:MAG: hypothetical protein WDN04_13280 [Rhodospirillales bacterium]
MAIQLDPGLRNEMANRLVTDLGSAPKLLMYTGAAPADTTASDLGTLLGTMALGSSAFVNATGTLASNAGTVTNNGSWTGTITVGGTIGHCRLIDNASKCWYQGDAAQTSGGVFNFQNTVVSNGQTITLTAFHHIVPNA